MPTDIHAPASAAPPIRGAQAERRGADGAAAAAPLLEARNLSTHFHTERGLFRAVDGVSFKVGRGETVGLVGESGCGKSVTSLSVMGLVPSPPARIEADAVLFEGRDILRLPAAERRRMRGSQMSMIFQEPMTSLNPVHTVGQQIVEGLLAHTSLSPKAARERAVEMLELVRIPSAGDRLDDFPHRMSGGQRQRVMMAMALACEPRLLIADEPTTALDVTIQAQILDLLQDLQKRLGMAILFITHNLGVVAEMADVVLVMYAGKIVERAPVRAIFADPQHPYTIGLLGSIPRLDVEREQLSTIEGTVPSSDRQPKGCRFAPRCPFADRRCAEEQPPLREMSPGHDVACWRAPVELSFEGAP
jgi:peptide/nickel transport system ATP-binding protein